MSWFIISTLFWKGNGLIRLVIITWRCGCKGSQAGGISIGFSMMRCWRLLPRFHLHLTTPILWIQTVVGYFLWFSLSDLMFLRFLNLNFIYLDSVFVKLFLHHFSNCKECIEFGELVKYLKLKKIEAIFRFNNLLYDEKFIQKQGIQVFGMEFRDGHFPPQSLIDTFLKTVFKL